jgi:predicted  nucleic acid-binding Zn-ribbon protein
MSEGDRSFALATACDDLQAQLEAGDRSVRQLDRDIARLRDAVRAAVIQSETLSSLQRHLTDLRANMAEQRSALREVRRAARTLCETVAQARGRMTAIADEKDALERRHAAIVAEQTHLHETQQAGTAQGELCDHLGELQEFKRLSTTGTALRDTEE